jgi:alkylation response protein AidB-like acyl-CoA dehydrogenase
MLREAMAPPDGMRELVDRLAARAGETEELRRLPDATIEDYEAAGLGRLLLPARYGGEQADFPAILDPVRELAHGCTSSAWTLGFYMLHVWVLALFDERAQDELFAAGRPVRAPAPLAPTGRGLPAPGGVRLTGRWSWATGIAHAEWVLLGALCGPDDQIDPALVLMPAAEVEVSDTWRTEGMRGTGSADVHVQDAFVPSHRIVGIREIYSGTAPGAALHDASVYRWPLVPALAMTAAMPALGSAERAVELFSERLAGRVLAHGGGAQRDKPAAQMRLGEARVRLRACRALVEETMEAIQCRLGHGERADLGVRADARLAAAHVVAESRRVIALLLAAAGGSAHFLGDPLQRIKRDVDTLAGHVIFDYDTSRELAGTLAIGGRIPPLSMV